MCPSISPKESPQVFFMIAESGPVSQSVWVYCLTVWLSDDFWHLSDNLTKWWFMIAYIVRQSDQALVYDWQSDHMMAYDCLLSDSLTKWWLMIVLTEWVRVSELAECMTAGEWWFMVVYLLTCFFMQHGRWPRPLVLARLDRLTTDWQTRLMPWFICAGSWRQRNVPPGPKGMGGKSVCVGWWHKLP